MRSVAAACVTLQLRVRDGLNVPADQRSRDGGQERGKDTLDTPGTLPPVCLSPRLTEDSLSTLVAASPGSPWSIMTSLFSTSNPEVHTERQSGHRSFQHNEAANGIVQRSGTGWK